MNDNAAAEASQPAARPERLLLPAAVAGRFLTRVDIVERWIAEGRLTAVAGPDGRARVPESAVLAFQQQAYRREKFPGISHGLHSWPQERPEGSNLPVPVENAAEGEAHAARWPFPHA